MRARLSLFQKCLQAFELERLAPHRFEHFEVFHILKPLHHLLVLVYGQNDRRRLAFSENNFRGFSLGFSSHSAAPIVWTILCAESP